jgi:hypothetical protein
MKPLNLPKEASNPYYDPQEQTIFWCTKGALHFIEKDSQTVQSNYRLFPTAMVLY